MASDYISPDDYVDLPDPNMTWRCGRVLSVDPSQGILVRYIGLHEDREVLISPYMCAPFRTKTQGKTWLDCGLGALPAKINSESLEHCQELMEWAQSGAHNPPSPKVLIASFRGQLFFTLCALLESAPQALEAASSSLHLLTCFINFLCWWLKFATDHASLLLQPCLNPYQSTDKALISMYPELFAVLEDLFAPGRSPFWQVNHI